MAKKERDRIELFNSVKNFLFSGIVGKSHHTWTEKKLLRVRYYLIEFIASHSKLDGHPMKPTTIKDYVLSIRRGFAVMLGYKLSFFLGPIFDREREGLIKVGIV